MGHSRSIPSFFKREGLLLSSLMTIPFAPSIFLGEEWCQGGSMIPIIHWHSKPPLPILFATIVTEQMLAISSTTSSQGKIVMQVIPKQPEKSVSACVGQPLNLQPACIAQLIQVELLRRRLRLVQIQGASLAYSRFFKLFRYKKSCNQLKTSYIIFFTKSM
jgi:hypothetical protein